MKYYFPIHLDGGNRGCEAIAKGSAIILQKNKEDLIGLCRNIDLDKKLEIDQYITLIPSCHKSLFLKVALKIYRFFTKNENKCRKFLFATLYIPFINRMNHDDILISTGGDMMCYENNEVNYTVNIAKDKGIKSILWGCSIGKNNLTTEKLESLRNFSLIYARETMTKEVLNNNNINNVIVYPDPAFMLDPIKCELPECVSHSNIVGVNLSSYVLGDLGLNTTFAKEVIDLFEHIIHETNYHILLIPHVFWEGQDDRIVCSAIKERFHTQRISILDSEKLNYCQIRYIISKCQIFIGARTHAVISAYSTYIPAIALGYSIKSQGIAKDVGMPSWTVIDSINGERGILVSTFKRMIENKENLHSLLKNSIPTYKENLKSLNKHINLI